MFINSVSNAEVNPVPIYCAEMLTSHICTISIFILKPKLYCSFAIIRVFQSFAVDANQNTVLTKPSTRACTVVFCDIIPPRSLEAQEKGKILHDAYFSVVKLWGVSCSVIL
jgi:hypothetical protein